MLPSSHFGYYFLNALSKGHENLIQYSPIAKLTCVIWTFMRIQQFLRKGMSNLVQNSIPRAVPVRSDLIATHFL